MATSTLFHSGATAAFPSGDSADPVHLIGGERLVHQFDERDFDNLWPNSVDDASGSGAVSTVIGTTQRVPGKFGEGLRLDGIGDHVRVDDASGFGSLPHAITFMTWMRPEQLTDGSLFFLEAANSVDVLHVYWVSGRIYLTGTAPNGFTHTIVSDAVLAPDEWAHVAVTFSGGDYAFLKDGEPVQASHVNIPALYTASPPARALFGEAPGRSGTVTLDDVRVYDRVLTAAEVRLVMANPYFHPNSRPVADAGADVAVACTGPVTRVPLDASASSDPEGDALSFEWLVPEGASVPDAAAALTEAEFPVGTHEATVRVSDGEFVDSDTVGVHVVDGAPPFVDAHFPDAAGVYVASTYAPTGGEVVVVGTVAVSAEATDACGKVARVVFEVDDGTRVVDDEAPFGFDYAPEGVGVQYRTLRIVAVDGQGNASPPTVVEMTVLAAGPRLPE